MFWNRREILLAGLGGVASFAAAVGADVPPERQRMGVVIHSFGLRRSAKEHHLDDPLVFAEYCHGLGAGGIQTSLGVRSEKEAGKFRDLLEKRQMYLEGSLALPREQADVERFTAELESAKRCGVTVCRTVLMSGRRYETFDNADDFRRFAARAAHSLSLAKPVVEKSQVRLAVENHKDLRATELLELLKKIDSPWIGVCLDTGNNIALLEPPQETVALLAPHAFTTHIKDMGVEEAPDGFLLAEVLLGTGFLDLAKIVQTLRRARPTIRLNLEMITRDPLRIPCLGQKYWATLESVSGRQLAEMLALVRANAARKPLPRISGLSKEEQLRREEDNVRRSLLYARETLGS